MKLASEMTDTAHVSALPPSSVLTIIRELPSLIAFTTPSFTVAMEVLVLLQVTFLLVASAGVMVAVNLMESPTAICVDFWLSATDSTFIASVTLMLQLAVLLPLLVVTVMVAFPALRAFTVPAVTEATSALLLLHVTVLSEALEGLTVATRERVSPTLKSAELLSNETPVTATVEGVGVGGLSGFCLSHEIKTTNNRATTARLIV